MKTATGFLVLSLFSFSALFADITVSPALPQSGQSFDVTASGFWGDSCVPTAPRLFIADKKLIATFSLFGGGGCLSAVTEFSSTIHVPALAAGTYQLTARVLDSGGPHLFFEKTIEVAGGPSGITSITNNFDTSAGNRVVKIHGSFPCCMTPTVLFGSMSAEAVERVSDSEIDAVAPWQTQVSVVDITVRGDGYTYVLPSGFTYVNLLDYERFLVPVWTRSSIPGGFGSQWQTELRLVNQSPLTPDASSDIFFLDGTDPLLTNHVVVPTVSTPLVDSDDPPTTMFYVRKEFAPSLSAQLRIRDLSRESETWGTEIPVVRESSLTWNVTLLDIPMREGFRQMLRLYITDYVGCCSARVTFFSASGDELAQRDIVLQHSNGSIGGLVPAPYLREGSRQFPLRPAYAQLDLQSVAELAGQDTIWIRAQTFGGLHLWAFVSVTNNATQHVTTITPH